MLNPLTSLNCKGQILDLSEPIVMGILNLTPDSFFDGGRYVEESTVLFQVEKMLEEGAKVIDVGGMSSRPGAEIISESEELSRVLPIISKFDPKMMNTVVDLQVPYIMMHMQGKPNTMQLSPQYQNVVIEILDFFIEKVGQLKQMGFHEIIVDVGFGFGKTIEHNYQLLKNLGAFRILDLPLMVGLSRKSMIHKQLNINSEKALNGTTALHMVALQQGAKILRAHDVREAVETIKLWKVLEEQELI